MNDVTFENFQNKTGEDIKSFFQDFVDFSDKYYQNLVGYYNDGEELLSATTNALEDLYNNANFFKDVIENYIDALSATYDYWELLDNFETAYQKIETIKNSQKWFRSSKGLNFTGETKKDYILKQNQTLTTVADELGYEIPNDDWVDIALSNRLKEEDYDLNGGAKLKVVFKNNSEYNLTSVIDAVSGEKMYGLDFDKKLEFVDDDIKVLSYKQTILQAFDILLGLIKGDNPEFPNTGLSPDLIGGNNNSFQYPVIFRQLVETFNNDDSFTEFTVDDISQEQDQTFLNTVVKTRLSETLEQNLKVS